MDRADVLVEGDDNGMRKLEGATGESSWADAGVAVIRHGWWLGKRVAIAGATIASAPVVIPPLLILSILGLMLSFPFCVLFAGYACADKLIRTLVPMAPSKMENDDEPLRTEESTEIGRLNPIDEETREEEKWEKGENFGRRTEALSFMMVPEQGETEIKVLNFGSKSENQNCVMELGFQDENKVAELPEKTSGDEEASPNKRSYAVVLMTPWEEDKRANEPPNLSSEYSSIVELRGKVKVDEESAYLNTAPVPTMEDSENLEKDGSMELQGIVQPGAPVAVANVLYYDNEGGSGEQKLWDQVLAMGKIVGYKNKLHSSIGEELRDLYLFIGLEPPASLKDVVDLAEMDKRIRFLKDIIGVK